MGDFFGHLRRRHLPGRRHPLTGQLHVRGRRDLAVGLGLALLAPLACTEVKEHWPEKKTAPVNAASGGGSGAGSGGKSGSGNGGSTGTGGSGPSSGGAPGPSSGGGGSGDVGPGPAVGGSPGAGGATAAGGATGAGGAAVEPGGATIEIGGNQVPVDKIVAFIYIGQSNLAGRAQEPADLQDHFLWYGHSLPGGLPDPKFDPMPLPFHPKLWIFRDDKFTPAREPSASDHSTDQGAGPGMAIMRAAAAKWPDHTFISLGRGQSGQRGGYCAHFLENNLVTGMPYSTTPPKNNDDAEGNKAYGFYNELINERALKLKDKGNIKFGGIITMFGATEDRPGAPVPSPPAVPFLSQCLIKIASTYRAALGDANIPFIMGDAEHGSGEHTYDGPLGRKIQQQVRLAQTMIDKSDIILTDGVEHRDTHHFTMKGHQTWGERAIEIIDKRGWATWATK